MSAQLDSPDQVTKCGDVLEVSFWYPRTEGHTKTIEVGLIDVRAADSIRISYDFDRDGYVIKQGLQVDDDADEDWREVAFIKAWAREVKP